MERHNEISSSSSLIIRAFSTGAHLSFLGSRSRSRFNTLISTLLASLKKRTSQRAACGPETRCPLYCSPILLNCSDDLDGDLHPHVAIPRFDYFSKCTLSQQSDDLVCMFEIHMSGQRKVKRLFTV